MKFKLLLMLLGLMIILPTVSAVNIGSGTVLNATVTNTSMTFSTCAWEVDQYIVQSNAIEIYNATNTSTLRYVFPAFFNFTTANTNLDCDEIGDQFGTFQGFSNREITPYCENITDGFQLFGTFLVLIVLAVVMIFVIGTIQGNFSGKDLLLTGTITLTLVSALIIIGVIVVGTMCS